MLSNHVIRSVKLLEPLRGAGCCRIHVVSCARVHTSNQSVSGKTFRDDPKATSALDERVEIAVLNDSVHSQQIQWVPPAYLPGRFSCATYDEVLMMRTVWQSAISS